MNNTLTDLNLAFNEIHDLGLKYLSEAIVSQQNLERVDLVGNKFGDKGVISASLMVLARGPTAPKLVKKSR